MCKKEIYKKVAHFSIVKSGENSAVIDIIIAGRILCLVNGCQMENHISCVIVVV